jgi:hypothetical protein
MGRPVLHPQPKRRWRQRGLGHPRAAGSGWAAGSAAPGADVGAGIRPSFPAPNCLAVVDQLTAETRCSALGFGLLIR